MKFDVHEIVVFLVPKLSFESRQLGFSWERYVFLREKCGANMVVKPRLGKYAWHCNLKPFRRKETFYEEILVE